ncbi:hypothetical protein ABI59_00125 [Acidobacteria bacterium Mor1]|nr:hypothetical protein ABI59_00125 [Acidobacteria bacterium Mor1]
MRFPPAAALLLILCALAGCASPESETATDLGLADKAAADTAPALLFTQALVQRGDTLAGALEELGLNAEQNRSVLRALGDEIDLRRVPIGAGVSVGRDEAGDLQQVTCRVERERYVRVLFDRSPPRTESIELPVETRMASTHTRIEQSVSQAFSQIEDGARLTAEFADIMQWDVDLWTETRQGDRIRLVYERRYLGLLAEETPPFGDRIEQSGESIGIGRVHAAIYEGSIAAGSAYWIEGGDDVRGYFDAQGKPLRKTFIKSPLSFYRISSRFSNARRNPVTRKVVPHHGVDYAAPTGSPVMATAQGKVIQVGWMGALGKAVRVRHGGGFETIYGHLSRYAKGMKPGRSVDQREVIGYVGSTGRATGPHVHYTVKRHGRPIDPLAFENPSVDPLPEDAYPLLVQTRRRWEPWLAYEATPVASLSAPLFSVPFGSDAR